MSFYLPPINTLLTYLFSLTRRNPLRSKLLLPEPTSANFFLHQNLQICRKNPLPAEILPHSGHLWRPEKFWSADFLCCWQIQSHSSRFCPGCLLHNCFWISPHDLRGWFAISSLKSFALRSIIIHGPEFVCRKGFFHTFE